MKSIVLRTASTYLLPLLLMFSVFILSRGHYLPGGGFVGGLIAATAFVLHMFAHGVQATRSLLGIHPGYLLPTGLSLSLLSGFVPKLLFGLPFMTAVWFTKSLQVVGSVGTALFFDIGVYLVVVGVTLTILFTISEGN